jgi:HAD superfamily hydrolase (TIGR01450 family)
MAGPAEVPQISVEGLLQAYDILLLDAYGVLLDRTGPLPGATEFIRRLEAEARPYLVLSNSASRLPETMASDLAALGLPVPAGRLLTSGMLLAGWMESRGLAGSRCAVLGPEDAHAYVARAGGRPLSPEHTGDGPDAEVIVVADQKGFECLDGVNAALSLAVRRLDAGRDLHLVLCNPDLIYPVAPGRFGVTAGGLAAMLEAALQERYPERMLRFERLGKPWPAMYEAARQRAGAGRMVMIGDQPATDIRGANGIGIDSVLVGTGLARADARLRGELRPTWRLAGLGG